MTEKPLIQALISEGLIDEEMLDEGGVLFGSTGELRRARAEAYILTQKGVDEAELLAKLVDVFRLEGASVDDYAHIERDVLDLLPTTLIRKHRVIPAQVKDDRLIAYVTEPLADDARAELEEETGHEIEELVWPAVRYYEALTRLLGDEPAEWLTDFLEGSDEVVGLHEESLAELDPQIDWGLGWNASSVSQFARNTYDRDILLKVLLGFSMDWFDSSAILVVGNGTIQAVFVRDWPIFESKDAEELKRTRGSIDPDADAIGNQPGRGKPDDLGLVALFDAFGEVPDEELVTVPIPIGSRTAMVLLGRPSEPESYDPTQLEAISVEIGDQLESIIKLVKSGGLPSEDERIPALPKEAVHLSAGEDSDAELDRDVSDAFESVASEAAIEEISESEIDVVSEASESHVEMAGPGAVVDSEYEESADEDEPDDKTQVAKGMPYGGEPDLGEAPSGTMEFRRPKLDQLKAGRDTQNLELHGDSGPRMGHASSAAEESEPEDEGGPRMPGVASSAAEESDPEEAKAPRMPGSAASPDEDDSDSGVPAAPANATMFGLPLTEKKKKEPEAEEANANRTMFGLPLTAKKKEAADEDEEEESVETVQPSKKVEVNFDLEPSEDSEASESEVSAPSEASDASESEVSAPSEASEASDVEEQAPEEEDSEVRVVAPTDIGDDQSEGSKTLMGGMRAAADIVGNVQVRDQDRAPKIPAKPEESEQERPDALAPGGTMRGGIEAVNLDDSSAADGPSSDAAAESEQKEAEEKNGEPAPAETSKKKSGFIPGMMILKGAGKSVVSDEPEEPEEPEEPAEPQEEKKERKKRTPTPNPNTTMPDYGEALKSEPEEVQPRRKNPSEVSDSSPPAGIAGDESSSTQMGMQEDWAAAAQREEYEKKNEEVHDAWFDYFAPESSGASEGRKAESGAPDVSKKASIIEAKPSKEKLESDDLPDFFGDDESDAQDSHPSMTSEPSEPRTIPPEMLERLLESGPNALDLQESLMELEDRDPSVAFAAADRVAESGALALEPLSELFPGRVFVDRYQHTAETLPPVGEHGPVLAALVRIGGDEAALVASKHIRSTSNERRFYATYLLTEVPAELALSDLTERAFDKDRQIRDVAAKVLRGYTRSPHFRVRVLKPLRAAMEGDDEIRLEAAADMLSTFRDVQSVPVLINALGKHPEHTNRVIYHALQTITLKEWSSPYEWKTWWESAATEPRSKWILEAMDSASENLRQVAFDEIQRIPGLESSYHYDQPKKLRQRARAELEAWLKENENAGT